MDYVVLNGHILYLFFFYLQWSQVYLVTLNNSYMTGKTEDWYTDSLLGISQNNTTSNIDT